jgi:uncharacterized protein DUF3224
MMTETRKATGTLSIKAWDEQPYAEAEGAPKLTNAKVTALYSGGLEGEGISQSVMVYPNESTATYFGYERFVGTLDGQQGTFVVRTTGSWEAGVAHTTFEVVPGTATGDLRGLQGHGGADATSDPNVPYWLEYSFEE